MKQQKVISFRPPRRGNYLLRISPPVIQLAAYTTGGLKQLYKSIQKSEQTALHKYGCFTNEKGIFCPEKGMPLMATRYKFLEVLGKGQSALLIKAQDTFKDNQLVSIKVLHSHYNALGAQEMDCLRKLNRADPTSLSATLRLYTTFTFDDHYCMVCELLHPRSLLHALKDVHSTNERMKRVRKIAYHLLQALGFLQQHNVIHADLKPDNILLRNENDLSSLKIVDFGNAIHCVHDELSLYYDDFELQTLLYRAPEVMFGMPFGMEVDMWSLGCVLAELYSGQPLFQGQDKVSVLNKIVEVVGTVPEEPFQRGKFYKELMSSIDNASAGNAHKKEKSTD